MNANQADKIVGAFIQLAYHVAKGDYNAGADRGLVVQELLAAFPDERPVPTWKCEACGATTNDGVAAAYHAKYLHPPAAKPTPPDAAPEFLTTVSATLNGEPAIVMAKDSFARLVAKTRDDAIRECVKRLREVGRECANHDCAASDIEALVGKAPR